MKSQALDYRQEYSDHRITEINGDGGLDHAEDYEKWIEKINIDLTRNEDVNVPATTYFAIAGEKIVGTIQVRHFLNDCLLVHGGNIGYGVRPSERRKGYATKMLALALEKCRELGIEKALITCNGNNIASARTILRNGGVLENEITQTDGTVTQRYWIDTLPIKPVAAVDLPECLYVIRKSFATVAAEFGLTEENCPRHTSFMKLSKLEARFAGGARMFALRKQNSIVGFVLLRALDGGAYELDHLAVLPEHRHKGYGKLLLDYCKNNVGNGLDRSATIKIGIIEENTVLKKWYAANGFRHTGTKKFDHLPFTVGFMEWEAE